MPNPKDMLQKQLRKQLAVIDRKLARMNEKHEQRTKADRELRAWTQEKLDELNDAE